MKAKNPVILIIRDGWGYNPQTKDNTIKEAKTPNDDYFTANYPHTLLACSGEAVGLPNGYQGNSEVGHLTIGSGRVIFQPMMQIHKAIDDGKFFRNKSLLVAINNCKKNKTNLHLIGLLQDQGVHSHIKHLFALLDLCQQKKFHNVFVHVITDGRDAPVTESLKHLAELQSKLKEIGFGQIATISGRYFAMDRDKRWDRTKAAYDCIVYGQGQEFSDPIKEVESKHAAGQTDEFIKPIKALGYNGFCKNDSVIFFNFRTDRTRQLTQAIVEKKFTGFKRKIIPVFFVAMTQYYSPMNGLVAFPNVEIKNLLGEVLAKHGLKQLRISETEKYAHVTFFFNGQKEKPSKGEDRILVNSPKVATYDLQPEMAAGEISAKLCAELKKKKYDFVVVNLVNGDMVGHTGKKSAIIKGIEAVDAAMGEIVRTGLEKGYTSLVFADHGNAEDHGMEFQTSHTINPVPLIIVSKDEKLKDAKINVGKGLQDIAPTVLKIMGIKSPKEFSGKSII